MKNHEIWKKQIGIIAFIKQYLKLCEQSNINIANSSFCYFAQWAKTPGKAKLQISLFGLKHFLSSLNIIVLNILGISKLSNYIILKNNISNKKFNNLVITNVSKKDFKKDGSCFDPCLQTNTRKISNTLWFLNCTDNHMPEKFDKNLIIFFRKKNIFKYDLIFFIISFFKTLFKTKLSFRKFFHEFSVYTQFSNIISNKILNEVTNGNFKKVINSYEAQPFQNNVFKKIKLVNKKIKTIGIFHTALSPISTSLIYRDGAPDNLFISGKYSKFFLHKYLNWPKNKIKTIPSLRYNKRNTKKMGGYIYLPFNIFNRKKIILEFENLLKVSKFKSINKLKIKDHPFAKLTSKRKKTIEELKNLMSLYKTRFNPNKKKKLSVFIGATSSVIVALYLKVEVIHICEDPIFETYSEKLWKPLKVKRISHNTFSYKLKKRNEMIEFSSKNNLLKKYC